MVRAPARTDSSLVNQLKELGIERRILMQMAKDGQLYEVRCEMPECYCPRGRSSFDPKEHPPGPWNLSADHYPVPRFLGGQYRSYNVRLAHVSCNARDYGWRKRTKEMLEERLSLERIAEKLNAKRMPTPHGQRRWTARLVRKAYVS